MTDSKQPAWKTLGTTYGNRAGQLLAEMATHAQGMQSALDELSDLLDLPPNHPLSARQVVMLIKDDVVKEALTSAVPEGPESLPDEVQSEHGKEVLSWVKDRCVILTGTRGGSTLSELHSLYQEDDGLLGLIQFSRAIKEIGPVLKQTETSSGKDVRRTWNLAVTQKKKELPRLVHEPKPIPQADWIDGGPWPVDIK